VNLESRYLIFIIALSFLSAFFSSAESALFSLGRFQWSRLRKEHPRFGKKVLELLAHPRELLATILFCNMLVNILIFSLADRWMESLLGEVTTGLRVLVALFPILYILLVGEVLPKALALCFPYRWSLIVAYPLSICLKVLSPVSKILTRITPGFQQLKTSFQIDELEDLVDQSAEGGGLEKVESGLIKDLIRFGALRVEEVMIPRAEMQVFQLSKGKKGLRELFKTTLLTKIPVYENTLDDISGVIYLKDFIHFESMTLKSLIRTLPVYPEQMLLSVLYQRMTTNRQKIALIVDEHGGTSGIITYKDILEEIIGEFNENLIEEKSEIEWINENTCKISASLPVREFEALTNRSLKRGSCITMAGYILENLGRLPLKNEKIHIDNIDYEVLEVKRHRLLSLRIHFSGKDETS
jgi:putative hemolysin